MSDNQAKSMEQKQMRLELESSHTIPDSSEIPIMAHSSIKDDGTSRKRFRGAANKKPPTVPKVRSPYWEHCEKGTRKLSDGSIQHIGICNYCKTEIPSTYGSTSGLKHHLVNRCNASPLFVDNTEVKGQTVLTNETMAAMGQTSQIAYHAFNQKRAELKVAEYMVIDEASFRAVEGRGFINLLHELQPRFRIPGRKKVAGMVYDLFLLEKAKIKSVISGNRVSITTDTWTSIQNINYMVVTAYFLDSDWKLHKRIISFTKIISHSGEEIGKMIEGCLGEWGIEKVFTIVVDNASSNHTAIEYLKKRMRIENTLLFDGKYLHLRCACHILNFIVNDGLKELKPAVKSIRNAVLFLHSSPLRLNKFRDFAVQSKFGRDSTVPMDFKTRWNSTYKMLDAALMYKRVFDRMAEESMHFINYFNEKDDKDRKRMGPPVAEDWENAQAFVYFLKKFFDATLELSATKTPTSQLIYPSMIALQVEIEKKARDLLDPTLQKVAVSMKVEFDKYWGNWNTLNPLIFIANILDPRNKLQMIKVSTKKLGGTAELYNATIAQAKNNLINLWVEYKGVTDGLVDGTQNMGGGDGDRAGPAGTGGLYDELYSEVDAQNEQEQLQQICNEVDKYLADEIEKRSNTSFNLLNWWKNSSTKYPILSSIAKDIFAIPSSSVASESAFSLGKRIVDPFRTSLSPKMVEALVCTSDWLKAEEFCVYKDPTEDDLELYKEIEAIEMNASINACISPASTLSAM